MPSLYTTIDDFQNSALGADLEPYWASKGFTDALDRAAMESSREVERYCNRILLAPPATTVGGTGTTAAGSITVPLAAGINIKQGDVLVFPATGEAIEVRGVTLDRPFQSPYTGTAQLLTPLANTHNPGDAVQVYRQERYEIRGKSTNGFDGAFPESQEGQMARMHAPILGRGGSSRVIMLKQYPLISLYAAYESLPWSNTETQVDLTAAYLMREAGWYRLPVGFYNPVSTIWRTQYLAGFNGTPMDVQDAVHLLMAARLMRGQNPLGATAFKIDDESYTGVGQAFRQEALNTLDQGGYVRQGMA